MIDIDAILPLDSEMTDEEIDQALSRSDFIARIVAGTAVATTATIAMHKIWGHFHPYAGID